MLANISAPKKIKNLLLGLVREISLREFPEAKFRQQFFIGFGESDSPFGSGFVITWWQSLRTRRMFNAVAKTVRDHLRNITILDRAAVQSALEVALRDNRLNHFLIEAISSPIPPLTLFDAYAKTSPSVIFDVLWERILRELVSVIDDWLFVYPLRLVSATTKDFSAEGACIVSSTDDVTFARYCADFPSLKTLSLQEGRVGSDFVLSDNKTPSWLFVRISGTNNNAFSEGSRKASMLLGVLISMQRIEEPHRAFQTSCATPNDYAGIFSRKCAGTMLQAQSCGVLLHAVVGSDYKFSESTMERTDRWLSKLRCVEHDVKIRADVAARWINQAAATHDHTRFLFFFFALDALFGERFQVEKKIVEGIRLHMSSDWALKCNWLFELRSELVHGGTASVGEWTKIERYHDHFESEPQDDIEELAASCLVAFLA